MSRWTLSIDFGTTYTTAAARIGDRPEIIEIDGDRRVPSIVALDEGGALIVGKAAENEAASSPANAIREPKRRLGEPAPVILGGRPFPITTLVAGILAYVYERAVEYVGSPPSELRLTHPATWRRPRVRALGAAAAAAGLPEPMFIPEPVAAAISYTVEGDHIDANDFVAVYDLGGGTFDTAVLRRDEAGGFVVEGRPGGDARMGGEYFDELLAEHLGRQLPAADWEALQASDELEWRQAAAAFHGAVRRAKEALSLQTQTELLVPLPAGLRRMRVTRAEFEELIRPHLAEATELLATTIADAGLEARQLSTIYLVGGASRIPLVGELLVGAFPGVAVSRRGDPKMVVALGATYPGDLGSTVLSLTPTPPDSLAAAGAAIGPEAATWLESGTAGIAAATGSTPPPDRTYLDPRTPLVPTPPPPPPAKPARKPTRAIAAAAVLALILGGGVLGANLLGAVTGSRAPSPSPTSGVAVATQAPTPNPSPSTGPSSSPPFASPSSPTPSKAPPSTPVADKAGPTGGQISLTGNVSRSLATKTRISVSFTGRPTDASRIIRYAVSNTSSRAGGSVRAYSSSVSSFSWNIKGGKRGSRTVRVWFQDAHGYWSATPISRKITFDNPPRAQDLHWDFRGQGAAPCGQKRTFRLVGPGILAHDPDGNSGLKVWKITNLAGTQTFKINPDKKSTYFYLDADQAAGTWTKATFVFWVRDSDAQTAHAKGTYYWGPCS